MGFFNARKGLVVLALLAGMMIAACGSDDSATDNGNTAQAEGATSSELAQFEALAAEGENAVTDWNGPTEPVEVPKGKLAVFISCGFTEPGCTTQADAAEEAAKVMGWEFRNLDGELTPAATNAAFDQAIALGADVILASGVQPDIYNASVKKAADAGIPFITSFTGAEPSMTGSRAEINGHEEKGGEMLAAKAIVDAGGEGKFAVFTTSGQSALTTRLEGVKKQIEKCEKCEIVEEHDIDHAQISTLLPEATSAALQKHPDLAGIFAMTDSFANIQVPVLAQAGSDVPIYTANTNPQTISQLQAGDITATVVAPLLLSGWAKVDNAARVLAGQKPKVDDVLPLTLLTPDRISELDENGNWDVPDFDYRAKYKELWGRD